MGIEPTDHVISTRPDGFEDRGRHQPSKHFRIGLGDTCDCGLFYRQREVVATQYIWIVVHQTYSQASTV